MAIYAINRTPNNFWTSKSVYLAQIYPLNVLFTLLGKLSKIPNFEIFHGYQSAKIRDFPKNGQKLNFSNFTQKHISRLKMVAEIVFGTHFTPRQLFG